MDTISPDRSLRKRWKRKRGLAEKKATGRIAVRGALGARSQPSALAKLWAYNWIPGEIMLRGIVLVGTLLSFSGAQSTLRDVRCLCSLGGEQEVA